MKSAIHRASTNDRKLRIGEQLHVSDEVTPRKSQNDRPPILLDECETFGSSEVCEVGATSNVVQITRPRETAGASTVFSEDLMNIQSIYHDQGGQNAEFSTTSSDVLSYGLDNELSKGIEVWRRKEFWAGWEYPC